MSNNTGNDNNDTTRAHTQFDVRSTASPQPMKLTSYNKLHNNNM